VINFDDDNKLRNIQEKPSYNHFVSSGIYVLNPSVLNFIKREVRLDMPDLLNLIAQSNDMTVNLFPLHEYWLDIGQMNDFNKAQFDFAVDYND
jgi:NDP-sugar pyrophosphorylase family protein